MPETMISGSQTTANVNTSQHDRDVTRLKYLDPDAAPFTHLLSEGRSSSAVATSFKFEWPEKVRAPKYDQINFAAGYVAGATSIVVDNGGYFKPSDLVKVPRTGEVMRVTAVSSNTLTVVRGVGSTAAAALVDNDDLFIAGQAFAEGADVGTERDHQEVFKFNYRQIFRRPFGATFTQETTRSFLGNNRTRLRMEAAVDHRIDMEQAFLFGERNRDTTDTANPRSYTGGFLYWVTTNVKDAGGTLTEPEVWDWAEDVFKATGGSPTRLLLAAGGVCSIIDLLAAGRLQTVPSDKTYGIAVKQWITTHGTFNVIKHRLLVDGAGGEGYGDYALAVDPKNVRHRFAEGRKSRLLTDRQNPGADRWIDEYLEESGLELSLESTMGILKNATS
jgi:hypothetical protein